MSMDPILLAWEFPRATPVPEMVWVAREMAEVAPGELKPDFHLRLVRSTGDIVTVQVVEGATPIVPDALFYVRGRGPFEVLRREIWPGGRMQLTLAAWPRLRSCRY